MTSSNRQAPAGTRRHRSSVVRGELLRSLRVGRGWTQRQAAQRAGLSDRLIRKAESGGPLEAASVRILAELYQAPEAALTSAERPPAGAESPGGSSPLSPTAALAKRFMEEKWNQGRLELIDEVLLPEFRYHTEFGTVHNREEMRQRVLTFRQSFSDFDVVVEEVSDHGDFVVLRWRFAATHTGVWLDLAPTHRRIVFYGSCWVQVVHGKFGNAWDFWDPGLLYQQLAAPADEPPA